MDIPIKEMQEIVSATLKSFTYGEGLCCHDVKLLREVGERIEEQIKETIKAKCADELHCCCQTNSYRSSCCFALAMAQGFNSHRWGHQCCHHCAD